MLNGEGRAKVVLASIFLLVSMIPATTQADVYKCKKAGSVSYQETPCEGANVQSTHIEDRDSNHFVGCFATTESRFSRSIEVRANGAGTYQLVDEVNPLGSGVVLKQATSEELLAVSNGLHLKVSNGLSRYTGQNGTVVIYTSRFGSRYVTRGSPVAQPITAGSLYGIYRGKDSQGLPLTLLYTGGGVPQVIEKSSCPKY
jgi:hypothetical protein